MTILRSCITVCRRWHRAAEDLSAALNYSQLLKVYRALLTEGVSLRDIVTIATVLVASSAVTKDHILLAADVRGAAAKHYPSVRSQAGADGVYAE